MRDRIKCLKCEKFFYRNNKSVVCPTCIQKDSKEYYTKKIADLEAKLAESEELNKKLLLEKCDCLKLVCDYEEEDRKLKQQLAEKEKEIESYEHELEVYKQNDNVYARNMNRLAIRHNQDKISFAVKQIVKTKEILIKFLQDEGFYENEWYDLFDKIDNQIKQLKEGK